MALSTGPLQNSPAHSQSPLQRAECPADTPPGRQRESPCSSSHCNILSAPPPAPRPMTASPPRFPSAIAAASSTSPSSPSASPYTHSSTARSDWLRSRSSAARQSCPRAEEAGAADWLIPSPAFLPVTARWAIRWVRGQSQIPPGLRRPAPPGWSNSRCLATPPPGRTTSCCSSTRKNVRCPNSRRAYAVALSSPADMSLQLPLARSNGLLHNPPDKSPSPPQRINSSADTLPIRQSPCWSSHCNTPPADRLVHATTTISPPRSAPSDAAGSSTSPCCPSTSPWIRNSTDHSDWLQSKSCLSRQRNPTAV